MGSYSGRQSHFADPAEHAFPITPSDTAEFDAWAVAIYVGTTGDVRLETWSGEVVTFTNVPVGVLPVCTRRIFATGTTAAGLVGLY